MGHSFVCRRESFCHANRDAEGSRIGLAGPAARSGAADREAIKRVKPKGMARLIALPLMAQDNQHGRQIRNHPGATA